MMPLEIFGSSAEHTADQKPAGPAELVDFGAAIQPETFGSYDSDNYLSEAEVDGRSQGQFRINTNEQSRAYGGYGKCEFHVETISPQEGIQFVPASLLMKPEERSEYFKVCEMFDGNKAVWRQTNHSENGLDRVTIFERDESGKIICRSGLKERFGLVYEWGDQYMELGQEENSESQISSAEKMTEITDQEEGHQNSGNEREQSIAEAEALRTTEAGAKFAKMNQEYWRTFGIAIRLGSGNDPQDLDTGQLIQRSEAPSSAETYMTGHHNPSQ